MSENARCGVSRKAAALAAAVAAAASCAFAVPSMPPPDMLCVGTFNIRCATAKDKDDRSWHARRDAVAKLAIAMKCDVLGLQEVTPGQLAFLKRLMPEYEFVATFRAKDRKSGEACPVCYRRDVFDLESSGTFWLSDSPDTPGSRSWQTSLPRICTYAVLREKRSGRRICFANTHPDHKSDAARVKGMEVVAKRLAQVRNGAPVVLVGDHNCTEDEKPAVFLRKHYADAMMVSKTPPRGSWRSFTAWKKVEKELPAAAALKMAMGERDKAGGKRIDFIYVSREVPVVAYMTVSMTRKSCGEHFSDHYPVMAKILLY